MLRGGAFKPRTSPYDFRGLKGDGIELLKLARRETGLPIVSEIMSLEDLPLFEDVDMIQVGARSMQNYPLLTELGSSDSLQNAEFINIFYGEDVCEETANRMLGLFQQTCPNAEITLLSGGQPVYYFMISAE